MSTSTKPTQARTKGAFTLFDTLVTLAIIVVLAALLVPSLLNWRKQVYQECLNATLRILNQACVRAGLEGASIPESNRDTLASVVRWYQDNGYIREAKVDTSGLTLAELGGGSFFDCTNITNPTIGDAAGSTGGPSAPGPIAAMWWNTRYIQLALPSQPSDAQYLVLEGSPDNVTWIEVKANVTDSYTDGPFNPSTTYYYRVVAVNSDGRTTGPTLEATTAPPLSAPDALTIGSGSTTTPLPSLPAGLVTYSAPTMPAASGASGSSGGSDFGGGAWLPIGTGTSSSSGGGTGTSGTMATPGAITFTNVTAYNYTLTLPTLPHDLVEENGRLYDFAWGWTLFSSTTGTNWAAAADWRSTLGPPNENSRFGWTYQQSGAWLDNPAPMGFTANPGTTYYYQLVGRDTADLLVYGNVVSVTTPGASGDQGDPGTPSLPSAPGAAALGNDTPTAFTLTMPALPANADSLTLQTLPAEVIARVGIDNLATADETEWMTEHIGLDGGATVNEDGLIPNKTYAYRLVAVNVVGSTTGTPFAVTTPALLPGTPGAATVSNLSGSSFTLTMPSLPANADCLTLQALPNELNWNAVNGLIDAASVDESAWMTVRTGLAADQSVDVGATVDGYNLNPGQSYIYRLVAVSINGSTAGGWFSVTTLAPAVPDAPGASIVSNLSPWSFTLTMPSLPANADVLILQALSEGTSWDVTYGWTDLASVDESAWMPANPYLPFYFTADQSVGVAATPGGYEFIPGHPYIYRLVARSMNGSTAGTPFTVTIPSMDTPPDMPAAPTASNSSPAGLDLTMPALPAYATTLTLQMSFDGGTAWYDLGAAYRSAGEVVFVDTPPQGMTLTFRVVANGWAGSTAGTPFDPFAGTLPTSAPDMPTAPTVTNVSSSGFTLTMPSLPANADYLTLQFSFDGGNAWYNFGADASGGQTHYQAGEQVVFADDPAYAPMFRVVATGGAGSTGGTPFTITNL